MADRFRLPRRALAGAAALALALFGLAACGDDDDAQTLTFTATEKGISGPSSAETGTAEIKLNNEGERSADLQLLRVEGDRSAQEVVRALGLATQGKPFPDWFFAGGGVGSTPGGESASVTQVLEPGTYWAINTETAGPPDPGAAASVEVTGESSEDEVEADDGEVRAIDYGFEVDGLSAGRNEILFSNTGVQPHHIIASPAIGDASAEDAERFFKSEGGGKPPIRDEGTQNTAVLEGGDSQLVTLDLEPGRYILYCFITDRQGGPPHALKGMVDEVEVEPGS